MRFDFTAPVRHVAIPLLAFAGLLVSTTPASAQGLGIGARLAWVHPEANVDAVRYFGGQVRLLGPRFGVELALDHHSESLELVDQKVSETPIQASLLMRMGRGKVAPFLLGGPGWYRRRVETLNGSGNLSVSNTEFGWHAGIGLEVLAGKHFGVHGDYRYTFVDFHKNIDEGFIGGIVPNHRGSMWTLGATFYF